MTKTSTAKLRPSSEATVLFGTTPSRIFDQVTDCVDAALRDGVSSLPFLPPSDSQAKASSGGGSSGEEVAGDERLLSILRVSYGTNLDVAEAYAFRNVFSLPASYSRKRRESIVAAYLSSGGAKGGANATDKENVANGSVGGTSNVAPADPINDSNSNRNAAVTHEMPKSKSDIPTPEEIQSVQDETDQLRSKLRAAKRLQSDFKLILAKMGKAQEVARTAKRTLDEVGGVGGDGGEVHEKVTAAVMGKDGLTALTESGSQLIRSLDEEKEARSKDGSNEEDGVVDLMAGHDAAASKKAAKKQLTIEEDMERRRKVVKTGEGRDGLGKLTNLLRER